MKATLSLGKVAYSSRRQINAVELELNLRTRSDFKRTIDLEPVNEYTELSICGGVWNGPRTDYIACGQMVDEIARLIPSKRVRRIAAIWRRWHLNGLKAGTRPQESLLDWRRSQLSQEAQRSDTYEARCAALEFMGLLVDRGYWYGSAWLFEPLPAEVVSEITALFSEGEALAAVA